MTILTVVGLFTGLPGTPQQQLNVDLDGVIEDQKHYGQTRIVNARSRVGYPKPPIGSTEWNWRMFSAITLAEVAEVQRQYNERYQRHVGDILPEWFGPNIVFQGDVPHFGTLADGTIFELEGGPVLQVTSENTSCKTPGKLIAERLGLPIENAKEFVTYAKGHRGVVGSVIKEGIITVGMKAILREPNI